MELITRSARRHRNARYAPEALERKLSPTASFTSVAAHAFVDYSTPPTPIAYDAEPTEVPPTPPAGPTGPA